MPPENEERVDVLEGASALYYGSTSSAGVVNLVNERAGALPALPDPKRLLGSTAATFDAEVTNTQARADCALAAGRAPMVEAGPSEARRDRRLSIFSDCDVHTGAGRITGNSQRPEQRSDLPRTELSGTFAAAGWQHEVTPGAARTTEGPGPDLPAHLPRPCAAGSTTAA